MVLTLIGSHLVLPVLFQLAHSFKFGFFFFRSILFNNPIDLKVQDKDAIFNQNVRSHEEEQQEVLINQFEDSLPCLEQWEFKRPRCLTHKVKHQIVREDRPKHPEDTPAGVSVTLDE